MMLAEERQVIIRERLAEHGKVLANALALEFRVSEDTVRRDLRDLARAGLCRRVYGGALARASEAKTGPEAVEVLDHGSRTAGCCRSETRTIRRNDHDAPWSPQCCLRRRLTPRHVFNDCDEFPTCRDCAGRA
ncbi:MAG: DeoR/GlpR transcriptional regulator, partial [Mesorhizobium sp.]